MKNIFHWKLVPPPKSLPVNNMKDLKSKGIHNFYDKKSIYSYMTRFESLKMLGESYLNVISNFPLMNKNESRLQYAQTLVNYFFMVDSPDPRNIFNKIIDQARAKSWESPPWLDLNLVLGEFDEVYNKYEYYLTRKKLVNSNVYQLKISGELPKICIDGDDSEFNSIIKNYIWKTYGNTIKISNHKSIKSVSIDEYQLFGSTVKLVDSIYNEHCLLLEKGFSRSYLFIGEPGCGKSSIAAIFAAKKPNSKIMIIDGVAPSKIQEMILILNPDFIIINDIDRIRDNSLHVFEEVKMKNPNVTFILTANNFAGIIKDPAMRRPGRIDEIIEIENPSYEDRMLIIKGYLNQFNIKMSQEDVDFIAEKSENMNGSWIKEVCIKLHNKDVRDVFKTYEKLNDLYKKYSGESYSESVIGPFKNILPDDDDGDYDY